MSFQNFPVDSWEQYLTTVVFRFPRCNSVHEKEQSPRREESPVKSLEENSGRK